MSVLVYSAQAIMTAEAYTLVPGTRLRRNLVPG